MNSRPEQIEFIRINGEAVADCARDGYRDKGRGMVCVLCEDHNELTRMVPFDYLPEIGASKLFTPWYGTKEARMVAGYDPATELIVLFVRKSTTGGTELDSYRVKTKPS